VVCHLEITILLAAATGTVFPPIFCLPVCSPTGVAGKNAETGFMRCSPCCHYRKQWVAKENILIYIVKANLSKILAFYRDDQKIFKYGSGSY
jgi:hypothetical protein